MTLKQYVYSVITALIVVGVTLFSLQNFQDVNVTIPFVGVFHTKLFVVVVFSFLAGFLTAGFLSLLFRILTFPSTLRERKRRNGEVRPVPQGLKDSKEENSGEGTVR